MKRRGGCEQSELLVLLYVKTWPNLQHISSPTDCIGRWHSLWTCQDVCEISQLNTSSGFDQKAWKSPRLVVNLGSDQPNSLLLLQLLPAGEMHQCERLCCWCTCWIITIHTRALILPKATREERRGGEAGAKVTRLSSLLRINDRTVLESQFTNFHMHNFLVHGPNRSR